MTTVVAVNGVDISASVLFASASFLAVAGNGVGSCAFSVRDPGLIYAFTVGDEVTLDVAGVRVWGGYVTQAVRTFPLAVMPTTGSPLWQIKGADYNILFDKRVVRDLSNLNNTFTYAPGTYDDTIITDIFANYLDVGGDGLTTDIHRVAVAILDIPGVTTGRNTPNGGSAASQGFTWREVMYAVVRVTGAIYYISPSKVFTYVDVDTPSNSHVLSDAPQLVANGIGVNTLKVLDDASDMRNDALVWGAGIGSAKMVFSRKTDAASVAAHNRWQYGDFNTGIYKQASADTIAAVYVDGSPSSKRGGKNPKVVYSATIFEPDVLVGERVRCVSTIFGFDTTLPIRRVAIKTPNPATAVFTLDCSFDIDAPWSIFDIYPWNIKLPKFHFPGPYPPGSGTSGGAQDCTSYYAFYDTFDNRTVVFNLASSANWGLPSTAGASAYGTTLLSATSPQASFSVAGGTGIIQTVWGTATIATTMTARINLPAPFAGVNAFTMRCKFTIDEHFVNAGPGSSSYDFRWELFSTQGGGATSRGNADFGNNSANIAGITDGGTYIFEIDYKPNTTLLDGYVRARYWLDGDAIPVTYSTNTTLVAGAAGAGFTQDFLNLTFSTANVFPNQGIGPTFSFDWLAFAYCRTIAGSPTGYQCETATDEGDHATFDLSWPYFLGTTEVYLNGTRQRRNIDYNEVAGQPRIAFVAPLVGTIAVRVCYVAAGGS